MKSKFACLAVLLLMFVTIAGTAFAQDKAGQFEWKKEKTLAGFSATYRLYFFDKAEDCYVNVRDDMRGLTIVARENRISLDEGSPFQGKDPDTFTTSVQQQIDIEKLANGSVKVNDRRFQAGSSVEDRKAPDVFTRGYLDAARKLPPEVQAMFFGKYL